MLSRPPRSSRAAALFVVACAARAAADPPVLWRVVLLEPAGVYNSEVFACAGPVQGGSITLPNQGPTVPALWNSSAASWINLLPSGAYGGRVNGASGDVQVGLVNSPAGADAVLWRGSLETMVILTPGGFFADADARGAAAGQQVGIAYGAGAKHAALWHGSAESFVDLHPPAGVQWSEAYASDGIRQGGRVRLAGGGNAPMHAALWTGTASSFVNMNPPNSAESVIQGMAPGVQAGWARFNISDYHAILWFGTPESWLDLNPTIAADSHLYATTGTFHGGYYTVGINGPAHAAVWLSNDPDDFVDLHVLLGPGWASSSVYGLSEHNSLIYAAGSANRFGENQQAVLWIGRRPQTSAPLGRP